RFSILAVVPYFRVWLASAGSGVRRAIRCPGSPATCLWLLRSSGCGALLFLDLRGRRADSRVIERRSCSDPYSLLHPATQRSNRMGPWRAPSTAVMTGDLTNTGLSTLDLLSHAQPRAEEANTRLRNA